MSQSTIDNFARIIAGFPVSRVAVRSSNAICLLLREDYTQWLDYTDEGEHPAEKYLEKRLVGIFLNKPDSWSWAGLGGLSRSTIGACQAPEEKAVVGSLDGEIYSTGSGSKGREQPLLKGQNALRGGLLKLRMIAGHLFACGGNRSFAVRTGNSDWRWFSELFPAPEKQQNGLPQPAGFNDVDGFNIDDMYLVGNQGDVWHFDGHAARQIDFPSNIPLTSVCCGGDGRVYIGAAEGRLFCGRNDSWREIKTQRQALPLSSLAWHDETLWATNDTGLWRLESERLSQEAIPSTALVSSGSLAAADGLLLVGGRYGAAYHTKGKWTQIFNYEEMFSKCQQAGKLDGVLRARWHEFQ